MNYQEAYGKLKAKGQEHLLSCFETLNETEQANLLSQIEELDLGFLDLIGEAPDALKGDPVYAPLPAFTAEEIDDKRAEYEEAGLKAIREGKTAAVLLAGGQGTRLGFDHPKGMYNVGITRALYIFECLMNNLMRVTKRAGVSVPFYVMTSEINHDETVAFFEAHDYFGYDRSYVRFFKQDMAPCAGYDGKVLMENPGRIATSPNGNGGWFHSLKKAGLVEDLKARGCEYIDVFAVDNVLQRILDPAFVGVTLLKKADVGAMVVSKADPRERVGVICTKNDHPSIVEYYEITDDMANLKDENGRLLYNYGVILNYLLSLDKLEAIAGKRMPVHVVEKKIPNWSKENGFVKPDSPNGYKFELLILDMIELMDSCVPFEVRREEAFAPIKNPTGVDSVESARALLLKNGVNL